MLKCRIAAGRALQAAAMAVSLSVAAVGIAGAQTSELIGRLVGPEIVGDVAKFPTSFNEAPALAEQAGAGMLPPVADRLPVRDDLLVLEPLEAIGKYGGTWRRAFTGPGDAENGNRIIASEKLLFSDASGNQTRPSVAKSISVNDDGTRFTLTLRRGMKWSDGAPFTADDIIWWYENAWLNKELIKTVPADLSIDGEQGRIEKVNDHTVAYIFPKPYFLFEEILRGDTFIGGGPARHGSGSSTFGMGGYTPAHYMMKFHASFADPAALKAEMEKGDYKSWVELYLARNNWALNPEKPVLGPWRTVSPINTQTWTLERNPYYHAVDTAGNQLPYIDRIEMNLAENLEVLNLRAIAGEYDFQSRHLDITKLPVFLENRQKGNYQVHLNPGQVGGAATVFFNLAYDADPEIRKWTSNADFRRALSMAIDREQINEVFFLGLGTPGSAVVAEDHPHNPGPEWRSKWSTLDVDAANALLDKIGLARKDSEGFRVRTDDGKRLRLEIVTWAAQFIDFTGMAEMVAEDWARIGIEARVTEVERSLGQTRLQANQNMIELSEGSGTDTIWANPQNMLPINLLSRLGSPYAKWYASVGKEGTKPEDPEILRAYQLFRSAPGLPADKRAEVARELWRISVDQQWGVGLVGLAPASYGVHIASNRLGNVPERMSMVRDARVPGGAWPPTFYFRD